MPRQEWRPSCRSCNGGQLHSVTEGTMKRRGRLAVIVLAGAVGLVALAVAYSALWHLPLPELPDSCLPGGNCEVIDNALVGRPEGQVREAYGEPETDSEGYIALGLYHPPSLPPGPVRTLVFRRPQGTLWVWVNRRGGEWVCFESCEFGDGVVF